MLRFQCRLFSARYRLNQKLNKDLLRCELDAIDEVVRDSKIKTVSVEEASEQISQRTAKKARRMMGITRNGTVNKDKVQKYYVEAPKVIQEDDEGESLSESSRDKSRSLPDQLRRFESMRASPKFQDLTHPEARRVQELFQRKKMLNRRIEWLKNNQIIDPVKSVSKDMKKKERQDRIASASRENRSRAHPP